jgi:hypothetical protein
VIADASAASLLRSPAHHAQAPAAHYVILLCVVVVAVVPVVAVAVFLVHVRGTAVVVVVVVVVVTAVAAAVFSRGGGGRGAGRCGCGDVHLGTVVGAGPGTLRVLLIVADVLLLLLLPLLLLLLVVVVTTVGIGGAARQPHRDAHDDETIGGHTHHAVRLHRYQSDLEHRNNVSKMSQGSDDVGLVPAACGHFWRGERPLEPAASKVLEGVRHPGGGGQSRGGAEAARSKDLAHVRVEGRKDTADGAAEGQSPQKMPQGVIALRACPDVADGDDVLLQSITQLGWTTRRSAGIADGVLHGVLAVLDHGTTQCVRVSNADADPLVDS